MKPNESPQDPREILDGGAPSNAHLRLVHELDLERDIERTSGAELPADPDAVPAPLTNRHQPPRLMR